MSSQDQVETFNKEMKELAAELEGHREGPRLIRLVKSLVKLTASPKDAAAIAESEKPDPKEVKRQELAAQIAALQKQAESL